LNKLKQKFYIYLNNLKHSIDFMLVFYKCNNNYLIEYMKIDILKIIKKFLIIYKEENIIILFFKFISTNRK
jgi:hypothetical protein